MTQSLLPLAILLPFAGGAAVLVLALRKARPTVGAGIALAVTAGNLLLALSLFGPETTCSLPWAGLGLELAFRAYHFSAFIVSAAACFGFLVTLFSWKFLRGHSAAGQFYAYLLISLAMVNGAVLADHLVALLFFWEGLLLTLFGMIAIGRPGAFRTATKAFIIIGISDLCMMVGIALTGKLAGTLALSRIHLGTDGAAGLAMALLTVGAISKGGSMPFHSWIPDAAVDAPLPFMALVPGSLEKLLGIYFLTRICMDMFHVAAGSWASTSLMVIGSATILLAVLMALVQKDYKKLLSFHAISQVGYMILGVGTGSAIGIVGGLFHMVNNGLYKSCLFLTAGSVEKQTGTTNLAKLGGLWRKMPVTFACFVVAAMSISGLPPFNGFFSKELIYDAAMERHPVFYLAALLGSFFTAASFLKLGHAAFGGRRSAEQETVKESPASMLIPMIVIAAGCVLFGVYNALPVDRLIAPVLGTELQHGPHHSFSGMPASPMLVGLTLAALAAALVNHLIGVRISGSGLGAVDHIHHAPGLAGIYDRAERRVFDPYEIGLRLAGLVAKAASAADRAVDWVYETLAVGLGTVASKGVRLVHGGNYAAYVAWCLAGSVAILVFLLISI